MPDVELARSIARPQPMMSKDMQKRLWLMIAQHVIEEEKDIEKLVGSFVCLFVCLLWGVFSSTESGRSIGLAVHYVLNQGDQLD